MLRALFIITTFLAYYGAIPFLSLSTLGPANYMAPIFVTLLAAFAIREPVGLRSWIVVLLGFGGVIVLLRPGSDAFYFWALMPIIGAAFYALAHITTRAKCQDVPTTALSLSTNIVMALAGFIVGGLLLLIQQSGEMFDTYPYVFGQCYCCSPPSLWAMACCWSAPIKLRRHPRSQRLNIPILSL